MKTVPAFYLVARRKRYQLISLVFAMVLLFPSQAMTATQASVNFGSADSFAVLAGTTITSASGGTIDGNIGVWPNTAFVPGVPPVIVNGTVHLGDPIAAQAMSDMTNAYNDASGRTLGVIVSDGELGGHTLAPGLYKSAPGSFSITSVDLTLDAQGDTNAVWIFQMESTLTVGTGRKVILSGGAQAKNIYWQVGSSATLDTTSVFKGNILAWIAISLNTGAKLDGKAFAHTAAVTLDGTDVINQPHFVGLPWMILFMD
ncbi:ice-binding family protein [Desulfovibrio sp. DV]|uniref:ice-binding family protein n=1 Tax=Desulfovibrio sp. DV TaxID=1844708 RepID=UPI00094B8663|nr:ice-binding family protein [Desulfovibrio sp. DV]